jgi:hypothetical protein
MTDSARSLQPLDQILGTRAKICLLRALIPLKRPASGREAARLAGVSHQAIRSLNELVAVGVLNRQDTAGQHLYRFEPQHRMASALRKLFDLETTSAGGLSGRVAEIIKRAGGAASAVFVGGSVTGDGSATGNVDLRVFAKNKKSKSAIQAALLEAAPALAKEFGVELSSVVITLKKARHQKTDGDALIDEIIRDSTLVILGKPVGEVLRG